MFSLPNQGKKGVVQLKAQAWKWNHTSNHPRQPTERKCTHPLTASETLEEPAQDWALSFPSAGEELSKPGWNTTVRGTRTKWAWQSVQSAEHKVFRISHLFFPPERTFSFFLTDSISKKLFNFATVYTGKTGRIMLPPLFTSQFRVWDKDLQQRLLTEVEASGAAECTEGTVAAETTSEDSAGFLSSLIFWNKTQHHY